MNGHMAGCQLTGGVEEEGTVPLGGIMSLLFMYRWKCHYGEQHREAGNMVDITGGCPCSGGCHPVGVPGTKSLFRKAAGKPGRDAALLLRGRVLQS